MVRTVKDFKLCFWSLGEVTGTLLNSTYSVSRIMLHEAVNGYSTVFSGAVFRSDIKKLVPENPLEGKITFVKAKDIAELNEIGRSGHHGKVGILC